MSDDAGRVTGQTQEPVEITPEMIEAGLETYWAHLPVEAGKEAHDRKKVADIYRAMECARRAS